MDCRVCRGACCESMTIALNIPDTDEGRWIALHAIGGGTNSKAVTFEVRCTALTEEGQCRIHGWDERPVMCDVFPVGGPGCLEAIATRRTAEEAARIFAS